MRQRCVSFLESSEGFESFFCSAIYFLCDFCETGTLSEIIHSENEHSKAKTSVLRS